jgi:hypothetical protein
VAGVVAVVEALTVVDGAEREGAHAEATRQAEVFGEPERLPGDRAPVQGAMDLRAGEGSVRLDVTGDGDEIGGGGSVHRRGPRVEWGSKRHGGMMDGRPRAWGASAPGSLSAERDGPGSGRDD